MRKKDSETLAAFRYELRKILRFSERAAAAHGPALLAIEGFPGFDPMAMGDWAERLTTYRYGTPREPGEGLRIGVARLAPRGIRREDRPRLDYFDLWLPLLGPEAELVHAFRHGDLSFADFSRRYRRSLQAKEAEQAIELLAGFSLFLPLSLGCYCADESRCHRSVLRKRIAAEAEKKRKVFLERNELQQNASYASPVCFLPEVDSE